MAIRTTIPAINHVAVTVTDLAVSRAWSTTVLDVEPVLDQDTGPFRPTVYQQGTTMPEPPGFPDLRSDKAFRRANPGSGSHLLVCGRPLTGVAGAVPVSTILADAPGVGRKPEGQTP